MGLQWILSSDQNGHFLKETDAEIIVKCLKGGTKLSEIDNILLDCKDIMSEIVNCSVMFIKRCNGVAHNLVGILFLALSCCCIYQPSFFDMNECWTVKKKRVRRYFCVAATYNLQS